jgi:hypothetical protein
MQLLTKAFTLLLYHIFSSLFTGNPEFKNMVLAVAPGDDESGERDEKQAKDIVMR